MEGLLLDRVTVAIALGALLAVTIAAIALDSPGPVLVLLAAGPLVASLRSGAIVTGIVALLALALAIGLGAEGEAEHLTAVLAVAAAGGLAVGAAHLRSGRERLGGARPEAAGGAPRAADAEASREELEAMLRGVADAVTAQAPDGRLLYANEAAVQLLGFESREALLTAAPADLLGALRDLRRGRPARIHSGSCRAARARSASGRPRPSCASGSVRPARSAGRPSRRTRSPTATAA